MADEHVVDTSSTNEAAISEIPTEDFTPEQRGEWLRTGTVPTKPKAETAAPPKPEKQASEPKPDTESDTPAQEPKKHQRKPDAEERIRQLARENANLKRQLSTESLGRVLPEPNPERIALPKLSDFQQIAEAKGDGEAWKQYEEALQKAIENLTDQRSKSAVEADRQQRAIEAQREQLEQSNRTIEQSWAKAVREFTAHQDRTDFEATVQALTEAELITEGSLLDQWIVNSPQGPALAYYFAKQPDEILKFGELTQFQAVRELTKLEESLSGNGKTKAPAQSKHATAIPPPPPKEVGGTSPPADEVEAALKDPDSNERTFRTYMNAANRRELASRKGP